MKRRVCAADPGMSEHSVRSDSTVSRVEATADPEIPGTAAQAANSQAKIHWAEWTFFFVTSDSAACLMDCFPREKWWTSALKYDWHCPQLAFFLKLLCPRLLKFNLKLFAELMKEVAICKYRPCVSSFSEIVFAVMEIARMWCAH